MNLLLDNSCNKQYTRSSKKNVIMYKRQQYPLEMYDGSFPIFNCVSELLNLLLLEEQFEEEVRCMVRQEQVVMEMMVELLALVCCYFHSTSSLT